MLHDPLISWPCEIQGSLTGGGSARKRLSRHRLLVLIHQLLELTMLSIDLRNKLLRITIECAIFGFSIP